jgi:hypothetical protein
MRVLKNLLILSGSTLFLLLPALSSSEMKITLKNGRSIIADDCRQINGKYLCDIAGGTVELDRKEIESMKEVKIERRVVIDRQPDASPEGETGKKGQGKDASPMQTPAGEERGVRGLSPEQAKQLDQINEKKVAMRAERDRLIKERDQLHQDVKNAGVVRNQEQFDAIKNRISELEKKINGFNDEVNKLNAEEARIFESSKNRQ